MRYVINGKRIEDLEEQERRYIETFDQLISIFLPLKTKNRNGRK